MPASSTLYKIGTVRKMEPPPDNFAWNVTAGEKKGKVSLVFNCAKPWDATHPAEVATLNITVA